MTDRRYGTPPRTRASLEQRLRNVVADDRLQLRARRQIAYVAVISALRDHARDRDGQPLFAIKGGVAVELLMGLRARATKDLDAAARVPPGEIESLVRDALARGWDGFGFRLVSWEPIRGTPAHRGEIKLQYRGQPFATVLLEVAPAEGAAGQAVELVANSFVDPGDLGLTPVAAVPRVSLAYLLAQKLHACTDHSNEERPNDRARDLIDVLLVSRLLAEEELPRVRRACTEIFALRGRQPWPPRITVPTGWPEIYAAELAKAPGFAPAAVEEAARLVDALIARIDAARARDSRNGA